MKRDLAQDLLLRIHPGGEAGELELLRDALERYRPNNLSELYMALRAVAAGAGNSLLEPTRRLADETPERTLHELLAR
jgi:hypothetical protein